MCNNRECAAYLKKNPACDRLMRELRRKWESHGKVTGRITLKQITEEERRVIGGVIGKHLPEGTIQIAFSEVEQGLQKTRFAPVDMKTVLEAYFGTSLYTNKEKEEQKRQEKEDFFEKHIQMQRESTLVVSWLEEMQKQKKYGYQLMSKEYRKDRKDAEVLLRNVEAALSRLENTEEESLLAVFAAEISGNPHYFDKGTAASQLLTHAVCFWKNIELPCNTYEWRDCMQMAGLVSDNIASMLHAFGVRLETKEGWHPAYDAFCRRKEPFVLTAENLRTAVGARAYAGKVYVVENEMVFLYLAENTKDCEVTLLCTSGQLRAAAFRLLSCLVQGGAEIYYSGDLDPEGMDIADRLWRRYGEAVHLWRMSGEDYDRSISKELLSHQRLGKLSRLQNPILCSAAERVYKEKRAGYQENIIESLLEDIRHENKRYA